MKTSFLHILSVCFLILFHVGKCNAQDAFEELEGDIINGVSISAGVFFPLFGDLELSYHKAYRINRSLVFELKPVLGVVQQLYLFEGNSDAYTIGYGGATMGLLLGRNNKFFDISIGAGYFLGDIDSWGASNNAIVPIGDIAYRNTKAGNRIRIGVGFPKGIFVGFFF